MRPRFGVMRGREFLMKDAYSFDIDKEKAIEAYNRMFVAYLRTFTRMGLKAIPMRAETGPIGGDHSHELIILAETGESAVYCDKRVLELPTPHANLSDADAVRQVIKEWTNLYAATEDVHDAAKFEATTAPEDRLHTRGIEVGQVFYYGEKYSKIMGVNVTGADGKEQPIHGGSYGIGVSRLVGAIIEASHDAAGIVWPASVAPFDCGLINLRAGDAACDAACDKLYEHLKIAGLDPLYDDTDKRGGEKFAAMDLIGLPWQLTIGPRGAEAGLVEVKCRKTGEKSELAMEAAIEKINAAHAGTN
jgi:prolyl-tRNA synthetase